MVKTQKELVESHINDLRGRILWQQASLKSIDIQVAERGITNPQDDFAFQKTKNDLLQDIEINTRMLGIFMDMLDGEKESVKPKSN